MFSLIARIWNYIAPFFSFVFKWVKVGGGYLYVVLYFIWKLIAGPIALVWTYVNALFWVHTIKRFALFPILVAAFIFLLDYIYRSYPFTFLGDLSVSGYLTSVINQHDYLVNTSVFLYQIGLIQALTIFFYFVLVTFVVRLFIKIFIRD